ncbi:hypothetical protein 8 [Hubei insect virus 2]|uniref:hypothetical protein 8 n=1 Tax=Hubei insect virus 2 TaxID=1922898 RepID=UPI00090BDA0E|nr:hypothetical protein 8 [Hubei insect virus 2]APG79065.1 hypothetical protein 8 [Hubei insect virus 2]
MSTIFENQFCECGTVNESHVTLTSNKLNQRTESKLKAQEKTFLNICHTIEELGVRGQTDFNVSTHLKPKVFDCLIDALNGNLTIYKEFVQACNVTNGSEEAETHLHQHYQTIVDFHTNISAMFELLKPSMYNNDDEDKDVTPVITGINIYPQINRKNTDISCELGISIQISCKLKNVTGFKYVDITKITPNGVITFANSNILHEIITFVLHQLAISYASQFFESKITPAVSGVLERVTDENNIFANAIRLLFCCVNTQTYLGIMVFSEKYDSFSFKMRADLFDGKDDSFVTSMREQYARYANENSLVRFMNDTLVCYSPFFSPLPINRLRLQKTFVRQTEPVDIGNKFSVFRKFTI